MLTSALVTAAVAFSSFPAAADDAPGDSGTPGTLAAATLSFAPPAPVLGQSVSYNGGGCAPGENVRVTLSYAPYTSVTIGVDLTADGAGDFFGAMPMSGDPAVHTPGTEFTLRADCGTYGQTDPARFATAVGTLGDPATMPAMVAQLIPDPVNPGATLVVSGVGCQADAQVTFSTDDPTLRVTTRAADGFGAYYGLVPTNPAAAAGTSLEVTVICGSTTPPVDPARIWVGSVTYTGTLADVPTAQPDEVTIYQGESVTIDPLANDTGHDARIAWVMIPEHGTAVIASDRLTFEYTPDPDFSGVDTFSYSIENPDGTAGSSVAVTVLPNPPDEPGSPGGEPGEPGADGDADAIGDSSGTGADAEPPATPARTSKLAETGPPGLQLSLTGTAVVLLVGGALVVTGMRRRLAAGEEAR